MEKIINRKDGDYPWHRLYNDHSVRTFFGEFKFAQGEEIWLSRNLAMSPKDRALRRNDPAFSNIILKPPSHLLFFPNVCKWNVYLHIEQNILTRPNYFVLILGLVAKKPKLLIIYTALQGRKYCFKIFHNMNLSLSFFLNVYCCYWKQQFYSLTEGLVNLFPSC